MKTPTFLFRDEVRVFGLWFKLNARNRICIKDSGRNPYENVRPRGLMDKASDFGSEDCRFETCRGRIILFQRCQSGILLELRWTRFQDKMSNVNQSTSHLTRSYPLNTIWKRFVGHCQTTNYVFIKHTWMRCSAFCTSRSNVYFDTQHANIYLGITFRDRITTYKMFFAVS